MSESKDYYGDDAEAAVPEAGDLEELAVKPKLRKDQEETGGNQKEENGKEVVQAVAERTISKQRLREECKALMSKAELECRSPQILKIQAHCISIVLENHFQGDQLSIDHDVAKFFSLIRQEYIKSMNAGGSKFIIKDPSADVDLAMSEECDGMIYGIVTHLLGQGLLMSDDLFRWLPPLRPVQHNLQLSVEQKIPKARIIKVVKHFIKKRTVHLILCGRLIRLYFLPL